MIIRALHWFCCIFLGVVFIYTGYWKLQSPLQFAGDLTSYQMFPTGVILLAMDYFPWVEITLGILLLVGWKSHYFAAVSGVLLGFFIMIMTITYLRGIKANCGCFTSGEPISPISLVRDSLILAPALFLVFESTIRHRWPSRLSSDCEPSINEVG
jgi:uncharacterized membrane protein YphA (DoxX/SURF4 family)